MNGQPRVTVITPSLNQASFIMSTIESVLSQDYPSVEYLVVDGGSTDGTLPILRATDRRVRWVAQADAGQADALNKGFGQATGDYFAWLNSDDVYLPGAIKAMAQYLTSHPETALVYGHVDNIDERGRVIGPARQVERFDESRLLNEVDFIAQPGTMFRRAAFYEVGGLDASMNWAFDYDLWLKMARRHDVGFLERVLAQARIHPSAKTVSGGLPRLLEIERMARGHGRRHLPNGFAARMAWEQSGATIAALRGRRVPEALRHSTSALRHLSAYVMYRFARPRYGSHFKSARRRDRT